MKALKLADPRIRFNHGFWDGQDSREKNRPMLLRHFDAAYFAGYQEGRATGSDPVSSEPAWLAFKARSASQ